MGKVQDLIAELKEREHVTTNYKLAKITGIAENRLNDYTRGKVRPDEYAATRIALALGREPIEVIAEIQAETETNAIKRDFWRSFLTRAASLAALAVALQFGLPSKNAHAQEVTGYDTRLTYSRIMRMIRRKLAASIRAVLGFFSAPRLGVA